MPLPPDSLEWRELSFAQAGFCSRYDLAAIGADGGLPLGPGAPWTVAISVAPDGGGARLSTSSFCGITSTTAIVPALVPAPVYVTATRPGTLTLSASHPQLGNAQRTIDMRSGPPNLVTFTMAPLAQLGDCVPGTVAAIDSLGNLIYHRGQTLSVSSSLGGEFFTSSDCSGTPASTLNVPYPDSMTVPFSFRSMTGGAHVLTAQLATSFVTGQHSLRLRVSPLALRLTPLSSQGFSDQCITTVTLQKVDGVGSLEQFDGGETVTLGGAPQLVYRAANCLGAPITQVTPPAGTSSVPLGLRIAADAGTYVLTVSEPGLGMASASVNVTGPRPTALRFVNVPSSGVRGLCYPASVRYVDDAGLPTVVGAASTVTLTGAQFWFDGGCVGPSSNSLPIPANAAQADFTFRETTSASITLRATSTFPVVAAQQTVPMSNPPPYAIRFSGAYAGTTNFCYAGAVELISDAGVVTTATMSTPVFISGAPVGSVFLGTATANCAALSNTINVTIPNGASSVNFIWRKGTPGQTGVVATSAAYGDAGTTVTATNPCSNFGGPCDVNTVCCSNSTPSLFCGSTGTCRCAIGGCVPRGGNSCGSSNNCCSGVISGTTCQ